MSFSTEHPDSDRSGHASSHSKNKFLTPFQRKMLQKGLHESLPEVYCQRIEIMLLADQGLSQTEICQTLGCSAATARHWMCIARSGMAHQWRECPIGRPKSVHEDYLKRLKELVTHSPREYGYAFRRWTASWLQKHLAKEFGIEVSDRHIKRLLKQMGLSTRIPARNSEEGGSGKVQTTKISITDLKAEPTLESSEFLSGHLCSRF
jgi:transposase